MALNVIHVLMNPKWDIRYKISSNYLLNLPFKLPIDKSNKTLPKLKYWCSLRILLPFSISQVSDHRKIIQFIIQTKRYTIVDYKHKLNGGNWVEGDPRNPSFKAVKKKKNQPDLEAPLGPFFFLYNHHLIHPQLLQSLLCANCLPDSLRVKTNILDALAPFLSLIIFLNFSPLHSGHFSYYTGLHVLESL